MFDRIYNTKKEEEEEEAALLKRTVFPSFVSGYRDVCAKQEWKTTLYRKLEIKTKSELSWCSLLLLKKLILLIKG